MGTQATCARWGKTAWGWWSPRWCRFRGAKACPLAREYRAALQAAGFGQHVSFIGLEAYMNARLMVEGLRRAGRDLTRPRFIQALESLRHFDLGGFELDYGKGVRQGSRFVDLTIIGQGERFTR